MLPQGSEPKANPGVASVEWCLASPFFGWLLGVCQDNETLHPSGLRVHFTPQKLHSTNSDRLPRSPFFFSGDLLNFKGG